MSEPQSNATGLAVRVIPVSVAVRVAIGLLIALLAASSLYFFYAQGLSNLYGDGLAHVEGARRIFDSRTPGLPEIGSVWLPLFHLLAAPLAINNFLWRTGLAGSLISTAAFILSAWLVFRLSLEMNLYWGAAAVSLAIFLLCPSLLYAASCPLTEPLMVFWTILITLLIFRFQQTGRRTLLVAASLAAFAGSLTRYDGWYLLPFVALFILIVPPAPWRQRAINALIFCLISGAGPLLWFVHNVRRFGNALEFFNGPYSAKAIYSHQLATTAFRYPTDGSVILSARYYVEDLKLVSGPWLLVLAMFGLMVWIIDRRRQRRGAAALLLLVPLIFYVQSMTFNAIPIYVPTLFPYTYYNLRYGLEMLPAIAIFPAFIVGRGGWEWKFRGRGILVFVLLAMVLGQQASIVAQGVRRIPIVRESILNTPCATKTQRALIRYLRGNYDGHTIIMALGQWPCVNPKVGIPYRNTITEANRRYWRTLPQGASKQAEWILVKQGDAVDDLMRAFPRAFADFQPVARFSFPAEDPATVFRRASGARLGSTQWRTVH
ncbi:MAG: ArnT family glycosyltransferase [Terriglobia bacterium]